MQWFFSFFPDNLDERLRPQCTLADYQLTQVALVHVNKTQTSNRSVSTSDILRLQQYEAAEILAKEATEVRKQLGQHKRTTAAKTKSVSSKYLMLKSTLSHTF